MPNRLELTDTVPLMMHAFASNASTHNIKTERVLGADFSIFSAVVQAECRSPLATRSVFISVCWRTDGAAPNTY
jgi:hypothetical protein